MEILQEQANEYMQVSALVCLDLDILYDISKDETMTAEDLRKQIALTHEHKESAINNSKERDMRYKSTALLFSLRG